MHGIYSPSKKPAAPPPWYNNHGWKMKTQEPGILNGGHCDLIITSGVIATIRITQVQKRPKYVLEWIVAHGGGLDNPYTGGRIECNSKELLQMFGSDDTMDDESSNWLIEKYGGTVASQEKFLRWGPYLNIPGPGTGHDGDANISVHVSKEIKDAVKKMVKERRVAM